MSENVTETVIGVVVVAAAALFLVYAAGKTGNGPSGKTYEVHASFRSANGISPGTDVRLAGVKVGTVSVLALNRESYRADVTFSIDADVAIPEDSGIQISTEGLLGGSYVEIMPGAALDNLETGDTITDTQGSVSLVTLLMKLVSGRDGQ